MCGIAGIVDVADPRIERQRLEALGRVIGHRGPDGDGIHIEPHAGLAFRRLAIIDLVAGQQPLPNEDRTVWLVFNGEIYNHLELRRILEQRGHSFFSRSDSEVIVHAYEEWGEACVERLRGMFAFGIWDCKNRKLLLARDHSGIKPLHFFHRGSEVVFASEAKAILVDKPETRALDIAGTWFSASDDLPEQRSVFKDIRELSAGTALIFTERGIKTKRYWKYSPTPELDDARTQEDCIQAFRAELERSIREQTMSDVPLGVYLSGGIDSAAVAGCLGAMQFGEFASFTTVRSSLGPDEHFARICARELGISEAVYCVCDDQRLARLIPGLVWMSEGFFDTGFIGRYQLARAAASRGIKVILTGQGIDEVLAGYCPSFEEFARANAMERAPLRVRTYRGLPPLRRELLDDAFGGEEELAMGGVAGLEAYHRRLMRGLLRFEDSMSMAAGVEVRVPLLDHELLELAAGIPHRKRIELFSNKNILRRAAAGWVPREILGRPKFAFNTSLLPLVRLLETVSGSEPLLDLLSEDSVRRKGYFQEDAVREAWRRRDYATLDSVLNLHLLDEVFVSNFDPDRFLLAPPISEVVQHQRSDSGNLARVATVTGVPRFTPAISRISADFVYDPQTRSLEGPSLRAEFVEHGRPAVSLSELKPDLLEVLALVDGERSHSQIAETLAGRHPVENILPTSTRLTKLGILEQQSIGSFPARASAEPVLANSARSE